MRRQSLSWRWFLSLAVAAAAVPVSTSSSAEPAQNKKPSISLKASPPVGFSPLRVVVTAELKGGANDFEDFYCASVEWDWGDGTKSETKADCDPYEAGKSEIKRRYTVEHRYKNPGGFRIVLRLKKGSRVIATANTLVQVRPGLGQDR